VAAHLPALRLRELEPAAADGALDLLALHDVLAHGAVDGGLLGEDALALALTLVALLLRGDVLRAPLPLGFLGRGGGPALVVRSVLGAAEDGQRQHERHDRDDGHEERPAAQQQGEQRAPADIAARAWVVVPACVVAAGGPARPVAPRVARSGGEIRQRRHRLGAAALRGWRAGGVAAVGAAVGHGSPSEHGRRRRAPCGAGPTLAASGDRPVTRRTAVFRVRRPIKQLANGENRAGEASLSNESSEAPRRRRPEPFRESPFPMTSFTRRHFGALSAAGALGLA